MQLPFKEPEGLWSGIIAPFERAGYESFLNIFFYKVVAILLRVQT
uniref:Uncharacterized protein n=1 Tax=Arundo donax TaxID=35708 RepID=A0A0A8YT59_ARUDO